MYGYRRVTKASGGKQYAVYQTATLVRNCGGGLPDVRSCESLTTTGGSHTAEPAAVRKPYVEVDVTACDNGGNEW